MKCKIAFRATQANSHPFAPMAHFRQVAPLSLSGATFSVKCEIAFRAAQAKSHPLAPFAPMAPVEQVAPFRSLELPSQ